MKSEHVDYFLLSRSPLAVTCAQLRNFFVRILKFGFAVFFAEAMDEADGLDVGDFDDGQHGENQNSANFAQIRAKIVADSAKKLESFRFV